MQNEQFYNSLHRYATENFLCGCNSFNSADVVVENVEISL